VISKMKLRAVVWLSSLVIGLVNARERESLDVLEGEEVLLQCRFAPVSAETSVTLYWIRNNRDGSDNAAIEATSLDSNYRVERFPSMGRYDLKIKNTTYNRDNGNFKCMVKEAGTGKTVHTKSIALTVLLKPSPPKISPPAPVATEGKPINLTCSSSGGSPPPQVRWYREGQSQLLESTMILGANRDEPSMSILTIVPQKNSDGATYRCTVWNRALGQRQKLESRASLGVNYFPRVTIGQHNSLRIEEGDTAVLTCKVDSKPMVDNVKWTRSGRYIATTFRHVIPTVDIEDEGPYYCEADNNLGQTGKAELNISVLYGPRVTVEKFKEVDEGGDVTVECKVSANPEPSTIKWSKQGHPKFSQLGRFLHLRNSTSEDGGKYACTVTNILNPSGEPNRRRSGNGTVTLAVRHKPGVAYIKPVEPVGIEGKSVTLTCGSNPQGYPTPNYSWWKASHPSEILATSANFIIRPVRMSSAGQYFCQPYNNYGKGLPVSVQLQVVQEPRIVSGLSNQVIRKAGDTNLNLTCLGMGKPNPTATWFKDGTEIDDSDSDFFKIKTSDQGKEFSDSGKVVSTLIFFGSGREGGNHVRPWDSGEYTCQFDNSVGRAQSAMALKVEHSPIVAHSQSKVAADLGEKADISCRMKAFPAPQFQWERDEIPISNSGRINNRSIKQISDYEYESTFTIWKVKSDSYGEYVCKATNNMGVGETIVKLVKKGKPESPSKLQAMETGANNIVVTWTENFNGGMNNTSFKLQWLEQGTSAEYAMEKWCPKGNVCSLEDLKQHTTYLVRVKALNNHGESEWSERASITTQIDVSQIPSAETIFFEKSTKSTSFKVSNYPLNLIAKLEVMSLDGSWKHLRSVSLKTKPYKFTVNPQSKFQNVRVRLCLESNDLLCGAYDEASIVDKIQEPQMFSESGQSWLMAVIVGILVTTLATTIVFVKCCCKAGVPKRKYIKNEEELNSTRPDILHPSLSFDNKISSPGGTDIIHSPNTDIYSQKPNHQYCEQSSTGSGNRGSVNSQDSLWHVKDDGSGNGYVANGQYDLAHNFESDYAHYPRPEEYLAGDNSSKLWPSHSGPGQQYVLGNGDQYAVPNKIKSQPLENINGGLSSLQRPHKFHLSFDDQENFQDESHVSTPRKVIREIIV